jgi:hypothetical protein
VMVLAAAILGLESAGILQGSWGFTSALLGLNVALVVLIFGVLDRGRLISPAYSRLDRRDLEKLRKVTADRTHALQGGGAD